MRFAVLFAWKSRTHNRSVLHAGVDEGILLKPLDTFTASELDTLYRIPSDDSPFYARVWPALRSCARFWLSIIGEMDLPPGKSCLSGVAARSNMQAALCAASPGFWDSGVLLV